MHRNGVFISYSHADSEYLRRLQVHMRPFERAGKVDVWDDSKIQTGQKWRAEIAKAIDKASVAVLLISADFLASDFIANEELPPLLKAAEEDGLRVVPIIIKPCAFTEIDELSSFQAINDPDNPVLSMDEADKEKTWLEIAKLIGKELSKPKESSVTLSKNDTADLSGMSEVAYWGFCSEELRNPEVIKEFDVYRYTFLDDHSFIVNAEDILGGFENFESVIQCVKEHFLDHGWEGDGNIGLLWIPPFIGAGVEDTYGVAVWHVKQSNNGISYLASPVALPFSRLLEQN